MSDTLITDGQAQNTASSTTQQATDGQAATAAQSTPATAGDGAQQGQQGQQQSQTQDGANGQEGAQGQAEKPAGAPEKYEFKPPEGQQYDSGFVEAYTKAAKELNLTNDAAQKMLDTVVTATQARHAEQVKAVRDGWATEAKADKEIGGDKLPENLASAKRFMDAHGNPALTELLNVTGLGNHPEIIRAFSKAGKGLAQDGIVTGQRTAQAGQIDARQLYSASNMNP